MAKNTTATLHLECALTDPEKLAYSKKVAEAISARARAEDALTSFSKQAKAEIAGYDAAINLLADKLNSGKEYREVECAVKMDFKAKTKSFVRSDTGEIARVDELSDRDMQQELELE